MCHQKYGDKSSQIAVGFAYLTRLRQKMGLLINYVGFSFKTASKYVVVMLASAAVMGLAPGVSAAEEQADAYRLETITVTAPNKARCPR